MGLFGMNKRSLQADKVNEILEKGYYKTEKEAIAAHKKAEAIKLKKYKDNKPLANKLLKNAEEELFACLANLKNSFSVRAYPDGEANDDSGLQTYMTLEVVVEGMTYYKKVYL